MSRRVVIIGAGIGELTSVIRLAQRGCRVTIVEARSSAGGLASGFRVDGLRFDAGPYVLLDRLGLQNFTDTSLTARIRCINGCSPCSGKLIRGSSMFFAAAHGATYRLC